MAEKASLGNSHLTNDSASARKRMIQRLNDKDIPPSHIMQLTGHKNVQSTNHYSHVSQEQQKIEWLDFNGSDWNALSCRNNKTRKSNADI